MLLLPSLLRSTGRPSSSWLCRFGSFSFVSALLCLAPGTPAYSSALLGGPSWPGGTPLGGLEARVIDTSGGPLSGRGVASSAGPISQPASPSPRSASAVATFRVVETIGGVDNRWTVSGAGLTSSLGPAVLWDSMGEVTGYRVAPGEGHVTLTSDTWFGYGSMIIPGLSQATYAVAVYANNTNPALRPDPSGMITPGYVPDLSAYNAGTGPGWVAVDTSTGNALLLSVRSSVVGTPIVTDQHGGVTGRTLLSPLGSRTTTGFASALAPNDATFASTFPAAIASNNPAAVFGCTVPDANRSSNATCTGGNLRVVVTPAAVVRGDVVGVRTSPAPSGALLPGSWSPSGAYRLNLSCLLVIA